MRAINRPPESRRPSFNPLSLLQNKVALLAVTAAASISLIGANKASAYDGYRDPFTDEILNGSLQAYRIDEGVDYRGHGKVYPIGPAIVTEATNDHKNFFGGVSSRGHANTVYRLTSGPAKGKSIFVGEACRPRPNLIGHKVTEQTAICYMHAGHFPGIETGWWNPGTDKPMAYPSYTVAGHPDGSKTAFGVNFSELLVSVGAPGGNTVNVPERMSVNPDITVGSIPANWPRWNR